MLFARAQVDAAHLADAFNDVDLCLKIRAAGWRIVWTPYAELVHHESVSRGTDFAPARRARYDAEVRTMQARWRDAIAHDPYYNPNLSVADEQPGLAFPPRVTRPWDDWFDDIDEPPAPPPAASARAP